jgi:hypothetical protein
MTLQVARQNQTVSLPLQTYTKSECRSALTALVAWKERYAGDTTFSLSACLNRELQTSIEKVAEALLNSSADWESDEETLPMAVTQEITWSLERAQSFLFCPLGTLSENSVVWLLDPVIDPTAEKTSYVFERSQLERFFSSQKGEIRNTEMKPIAKAPENLPTHPMLRELFALVDTHFPKNRKEIAVIEQGSDFFTYRTSLRHNKDTIHALKMNEICRSNGEKGTEAQEAARQTLARCEEIHKLADELVLSCRQTREEELGTLLESVRSREAFCLQELERANQTIDVLEKRVSEQGEMVNSLQRQCGTLEGTLEGVIARQTALEKENKETLDKLSEAKALQQRWQSETLGLASRITDLEEKQSRLNLQARNASIELGRLEKETRELKKASTSRGCSML